MAELAEAMKKGLLARAAVDSWIELLTSRGGTARVLTRHRRGDGSWLRSEPTDVDRRSGRVLDAPGLSSCRRVECAATSSRVSVGSPGNLVR